MGTVDCRFLTVCVLQCNLTRGREGVNCTPWPAEDGGWAGTEEEGARYPWKVEKVLLQLRPAIFLLPSWPQAQLLEFLRQTKPSTH